MISIRTERREDHEAVRRLIIDAFTASEFGHNGEAEIVEALRREHEDVLSLVAVDNDQIVGHLFFSPVDVRSSESVVAGMGLAPMAVVPDRQRSGIGTLLVNEGLRLLTERGCPIVVVLGHPEYYPRFGFVPAAKLGIVHAFDGIPQEVFFAKVLCEVEFMLENQKTAVFRPEFGPQTT